MRFFIFSNLLKSSGNTFSCRIAFEHLRIRIFISQVRKAHMSCNVVVSSSFFSFSVAVGLALSHSVKKNKTSGGNAATKASIAERSAPSGLLSFLNDTSIACVIPSFVCLNNSSSLGLYSNLKSCRTLRHVAPSPAKDFPRSLNALYFQFCFFRSGAKLAASCTYCCNSSSPSSTSSSSSSSDLPRDCMSSSECQSSSLSIMQDQSMSEALCALTSSPAV